MLIASYNPTQMGDVLLTMVRPEAAAQATEQKDGSFVFLMPKIMKL